MTDETKEDLINNGTEVVEDPFKNIKPPNPDELDDDDSDAPLPGEEVNTIAEQKNDSSIADADDSIIENINVVPAPDKTEVNDIIHKNDKLELTDMDNVTHTATVEQVNTPSAVTFDDEEIVISSAIKKNETNVNEEQTKAATISELLKVSDFDLELVNGDIDLNNVSGLNLQAEHVELPNDTNIDYLNMVDPLTGASFLEAMMKEDPKIRTYVEKLGAEIKHREHKGTHEREDTSNYYSSAVVDKGDGSRPVKLYPTFVPIREAGNLTPLERLGEQIAKATGSDVTISAELWNSGIWLGFKSPSEPEIIQLQLIALESEMKLGASTAGMVYSNYSVLYTEYALNLIFANILYSNVKVKDVAELKSLIKENDINTLLNNLNASLYPSGVERMITCKNFLRQANPCTHTVLTKLHFDRLHYKDFSRITDSMILHMSNKNPDTVTVKDVLAYQAEIEKHNTKICTYTLPDNSKIKFTFATPTIPGYLTQGNYWVSQIEAIVNRFITSSGKNSRDISDKVMEIYMDSAMRTNLLGLYLHYIKSIEYNGAVETDFKKINTYLTTLTKTGNLADEIISDILTLIKTSSLTIIGTTQYTCPTCKEINDNQSVEDDSWKKKIIPFNPLAVLFTLGNLKYTSIIMRRQ